MFEPDSPPRVRLQFLVVWALSWAAGMVDAIGWLFLLHVFSSHMTGNTASVGIELAGGNWTELFHHGWAIVAFSGGLLISAVTVVFARRRGIRSSFSIPLAAELALVLIFIWLGTRFSSPDGKIRASAPVFYVLLTLPAVAMGMQTVTVTRVAGLRVYTTYITGSLSKFAEAAAHYGFWFHDRTRGRFRKRIGKVLRVTPRQKQARHAFVTAGLIITYCGGAACGAVLNSRHFLEALFVPAAILALTIVIDLFSPVTAADSPRYDMQ